MRKILWASLVYTLIVIVWGAWVRISHSGDGCGASWPLCQGEVIPTAAQAKTWVEYTHRALSGIYGLLIAGLTLWILKKPETSKQSRWWIKWTCFFMITEALLGAKLVVSGLVGMNDTPFRAFVMSLHFFNSLLLTGSLALTALFSGSATWILRPSSELREFSTPFMRRFPAGLGLLFLVIGLTGTIAALSNTLYPPESLLSGLMADLNPDSHYLVRLRGLHPLLGFSLGSTLTLFLYVFSESLPATASFLRRQTLQVSLGFAVTVVVGASTLLLQAPVPLKLLHLTLAHTLWILILTFWQSLRWTPADSRS